ncbi:4a-hydroxytetrahydrobiopterin dehydratase [Tersicoccus sp. Bi-70]|uniref:4a-hydroxytetrahydrobiopterin dehydratase n=1 Tax=Tersicoccus sp. Bi-70 TaxID=1897634 RepID=UPI000975D2E8|nr:4a-hydroxytetrahydrobiopterin dehydratase [Tersicoccus sp. Bi-70]OMH34215.1 4a-hydroxytetrahydrobiopterin dehydratase [Tersicoccus sp. Bi-70]
METLTVSQILDASLTDWRRLAQGLHARYRTREFRTGLALVEAAGQAAEQADHHPDISLHYGSVEFRLLSHDAGGVTDRDVDLARRISEIAAGLGVEATPHKLALVELGLDTADVAALGPFWAALLTGSAKNVDGEDVVDRTGQTPLVWFQHTDPHETPRQRFHLDVWVPHDVAEERIAAAVAAGGTVVDDSPAPTFTVLADAEGNRACVCTCLGR